MYCVNVALGNTVWRLLFKDEEKAHKAFSCITESIPERTDPLAKSLTWKIEDDFGQVVCWSQVSLHACMFEDLEKAKMANVELFLHQQRVQVMAQKAAQSDPGLRAASMMNGPSVLTPLAGMPRN